MLQRAFRAARPLHLHCDAVTFMRQCRSQSSITTKAQHGPCRTDVKITRSQTRQFSFSASARATVVSQNPRTDEEGNDMIIQISERAAKRLRQITTAPAQKNTLVPSAANSSSDSHLRVTVTSGGCHGFQYMMALESADKIDTEEDTVFVFEEGGADVDGAAKVVLDEPSLELLKGSTVDFTTELIGSQFKIVGNPRATSSCGCGTSFDIE